MFYSLDAMAPQDVYQGYRARMYHGKEITFAVLEVEPLAPLPSHAHENEQVGLLVRGELTFTIDGKQKIARAGDGWVIPANAVHDAVAGSEGAIVIETWAPPRSDFQSLPSLEPRRPAWPDGATSQ